MISEKRRELFGDLYRLAEHYEKPPFLPGDIEWNAAWFADATKDVLVPFLSKYEDDQLAMELADAILNDANRQAVEANKKEVTP